MKVERFGSKWMILMLIAILSFKNSEAQNNHQIVGVVIDTTEKKSMENATIVLMRSSDSILQKTVRSNKEGNFILKDIANGNYIIMVSYPKYANFIDKVLINNSDVDLSVIPLNTNFFLLKEIVIKNPNAAIRVKGDTTEYKADSFRVTPNADVQELLKKMPGFQVNSKGEITAQGEKVNKILVDGDEFFSDDPAVVTKNLRADAIEKVQVFDKKSDQAAFTGIDDGQKNKTINLQLKEDKKNGYFGKAEIGSNFGQYGNGKVMANSFKGKKKVAGYVTTDNTKFEGLNWDEARNYADGGNMVTEVSDDGGISMYYSGEGDYNENKGLPNQQTAGILLGNKWGNASTNNTGQYQRLTTNSIGTSYNKTLLQGSSLTNNTEVKQHIDKKKFKFGTINEWGTDSTGLFKISLKGNNTLNDASAEYFGQTLDDLENKLNQTNRSTTLSENEKGIISNLSYRKKFAKKGRTISFLSDINFNDKTQDGTLISNNIFYDNQGQENKLELIDQTKNNKQVASSMLTNVVYTEPLGKKTFLLFKYGINIAKNNAERNSFSKNGIGEYTNKVDSLSNHFVFNTLDNNGSVNYRFADKKINYVIGSGFGIVNYTLNDMGKNTNRSILYNNLLPSFTFNYNPKQQRRIKFNYNGKTVNPTLQQIQPIIDNNDPLNISVGNSNLKQGFTNTINFSVSDYKVLKSRSFNFNTNFSTTDNAITNSSVIDATGKRISQYVNVNGNYNYKINTEYNMEVYKGWYAGTRLEYNYNRYINFINKIKNTNNNKSINYTVSLNYWGDKWYNVYTSMTANNNTTVSSIRPGLGTNYWSYNGYGYMLLKFKKIKTYFEFGGEVNLYQKTKIFPNQRNIYLFSPSIRKVFTKSDKWEMKLYVFDVFNKNTYVDRNITSNFISENTNNGIKRYFLYSLIYNFSKNSKPQNMGF